MDSEEPRQSPRMSKLLLAAYVNRDEQGQKAPVSMGRTLNVSRTGAGMEVFQEIETGSLMELEFDLRGSLIRVCGKVIHSRREDDNRFVIGIEFDEPREILDSLQTG